MAFFFLGEASLARSAVLPREIPVGVKILKVQHAMPLIIMRCLIPNLKHQNECDWISIGATMWAESSAARALLLGTRIEYLVHKTVRKFEFRDGFCFKISCLRS